MTANAILGQQLADVDATGFLSASVISRRCGMVLRNADLVQFSTDTTAKRVDFILWFVVLVKATAHWQVRKSRIRLTFLNYELRQR